MPELPEVETARRGLVPAMEGARIIRVEVNRPNLRFEFPTDFARRLTGCVVNAVSRRAKYLTLYLDCDEVLVIHLGMSGSFHVERAEDHQKPDTGRDQNRNRLVAHDHVIFHLAGVNGKYRITYNDPRRFGFMDLIPASLLNDHKFFSKLGVEPTGNTLDGQLLGQLFENRKAPLKSVLLDQKLIAGLGNIYVCEALWQAGLSPMRAANSICAKSGKATKRSTLLAQAVREIIARAIEAGGSSLNDHRQTDGTLGYFQHRFNVYDREDADCNKPECKGKIARIVQSGRSTYYCPTCQT